jgi:hypothetical protein
MHGLIHICDDVRQFGSLDSYSAFPFENFLGQMKRMLRSGNQPLSQLCRRLSEHDAAIDVCPLTDSNCVPPLDCHEPRFNVKKLRTQFSKLTYHNWTFCAGLDADCYAFLKDGKVLKIDSFVHQEEVKIIGATFKKSSHFYSYPRKSDTVGILKVAGLSTELVTYSIKDIQSKCMLFRHKDYNVCFPLLHGTSDK